MRKLYLGVLLLALLFPVMAVAQQCNYIYVTPGGSSAPGSGTRTNPANLAYALTLVSTATNHIKMAAGTYTINNPIIMASNLTIEGGFNQTNWTKSNTTPTIINRTNQNVQTNPNRLVAFFCSGINNFRLYDLTINVATGTGSSISNYGVYINNCLNYTVSRCKINSGNGTPGQNGTPGTPGISGAPGQSGQSGQEVGNCCTVGGNGGTGAFVGGFAGGAGGIGAPKGGYVLDSANVPFVGLQYFVSPGSEFTNPGGPGSTGLGPQGGIGGIGGDGLCQTTYAVGSCNALPQNNGASGNAGANGIAGQPGVDGFDSHAGGFYVPGQGTPGQQGNHGAGGGGGGGGGAKGCEPVAVDPSTAVEVYNTAGAGGGGGGGGEGGQGGFGGGGGLGGGGTFPVYVVNNGINGVIQDCELTPGTGGTGGNGGPGGNGGAGGLGGPGGRTGAAVNGVNSCNVGQGGPGGTGGTGGAGGTGGRGSDGLSIPIYEGPGGTPLFIINNYNPFEPAIFVNYSGCENSDVSINTTATGVINWIFDYGSNPSTGSTAGDTIQYQNQGPRALTLIIDGVPYRYSNFIFIRDVFTPPTITASATTICAGGSVNFSSSNGANSYQWTFPGGSVGSSSVQNPGNVSFSTPGTYEVTLATTSCCGTSIAKKTIQVINSAQVQLPNDTTLCFSDPLPILNAGNPGANYSWTYNLAPAGNGATLQTVGAGTYTVNVSYGGTCVASDSYTLTIAPSIPVSLGPDISICVNGNFPVLNSGYGSNSTHQWTRNTNPIGTNQPTLQTASPGTYSVTVITTTGCVGRDTLVVSISDPTVELGPNRSVCSNSGTVFLDAGNPGSTYNWTFNGAPLPLNVQQLPAVTSGWYAVSVVNQFGCTAVDSVNLTINPAPTAQFASPPTATVGQVVNFTDNSFPGITGWNWNFGDNSAPVNTQNPTYTYGTAGPRTIFLIVTNGICNDTATATINVLNDCNSLGLTAGFTSTDTVIISASGIAFFTNTSSSNVITNIWNFGDGSPLSNEENPAHVYNAPGAYTVTLTVINYNCTTSTTGTVIVLNNYVGLETNQTQTFEVFPNPSTGKFLLRFPFEPDANAQLSVMNMQGQIIARPTIPVSQGVKTFEIDLTGVSTGVYFVTLHTQNKTITQKVVLTE